MTDSIFSFFGLRENPFKINPDPRFLFVTDETRASADELVYAVRNRKGLILLTGEVGTGKTMLIRRLLDWLAEEKMPTALIFNSRIRPEHLLDFILHDFGVACDSAIKSDKLMALNRWLLDRYRVGQTPVLIVDEAQGLEPETLEEVRLLLNFETPRDKLLQIVLAGQPELETKLKRHELRQLRQRITIRSRTAPLTAEQTAGYIRHRLRVAGASNEIFDGEAAAAVHSHAHGIPRVINVLCEHAMVNACADGSRTVTRAAVDQAASECHLDRAESVARILQTGSYSAAELADEIRSILGAVSSRMPQYAQSQPQSHGAERARPASAVAASVTSPAAAQHFGAFERTFPNSQVDASVGGADSILSPLGSMQAAEAPRTAARAARRSAVAASGVAPTRVNPAAIETIPLPTKHVTAATDLGSVQAEPQDVEVRAEQASTAPVMSAAEISGDTNTYAAPPMMTATRQAARAPENFAELLAVWKKSFVRDARASYRNVHRQMRSFEMRYWNPTMRGLRRELRQTETRIVRFLSDPRWGRSWDTVTGATNRHWSAAKAAALSGLDRLSNAENERAAAAGTVRRRTIQGNAVNLVRRWLREPIAADRKAHRGRRRTA